MSETKSRHHPDERHEDERAFWAKRKEYDRNMDPMKRAEIQAFLAEAKAEAQRIDPETAEVTFWWSDIDDPYCVYGRPVACVGREYFARNPDSDIWVWFGDLPKKTLKKLEHRRKPSFSATSAPRTPERPRAD
jgi:hypothetical protein